MVANAFVGSGVPLTVTVGAFGSGVGWGEVGEDEAGRMVKRSEVA